MRSSGGMGWGGPTHGNATTIDKYKRIENFLEIYAFFSGQLKAAY